MTFEEFESKMHEIYADKYDLSDVEFTNLTTKIKLFCPRHKEFFWQEPRRLLLGKECEKCIRGTMTFDEFERKAFLKHGTKYKYYPEEFKGNSIPMRINCPKHGDFMMQPYDHLRGYGCHICNGSPGEKIIAEFLINKNVKFVREYYFEDLRDKKFLKFDFWLPDKNTVIEFQGRQHYEWPNRYHRTYQEFCDQQKKDSMKRMFCLENNIKEIELNYNHLIKLVEILNEPS